MSFYQRHIMPKMIDLACGTPQMKKIRARTIPQASGKVLEIGFGSGHNLPFYEAGQIEHLYALEPDDYIRKLASKRMAKAAFSCETLDLAAECIPLADHSMDTVVVTFTLCSIPGVQDALAEMRRVIKPDGKLLFAEHGKAPDAGPARWQQRIEPYWKPLAGGCHLTRDPLALLQAAGFLLVSTESGYLPKAPRFAGFVSSGTAISG